MCRIIGIEEKKMKYTRKIIGLMCLVIIFTCVYILSTDYSQEPYYELVEEEMPIVEVENVWIMEITEDSITVLEGTSQTVYECQGADVVVREQVADITVQGGRVLEIHIKSNKISGTVLYHKEDSIEIEGYGIYEKSDNMKVYQLYDTTAEVDHSQIVIGYDYTDFVIENGEIVAALLVRNQQMEEIRVLLQTSGFQSDLHDTITMEAYAEYVATSGESEWELHSGEELIIDAASEYFHTDSVVITPKVLTAKMAIPSIVRSQEMPLYRGGFTITRVDGGLVIVNELPLEEYLYAVVPSEMPASYPMEALKAQAICARTYAYHSMQVAGKPEYGAHVDDSTGYQVYQNIAEQEATTQAVKETQGTLLYYGNTLADTYYYSTSCGFGSDTRVWNDTNYEPVEYIVPTSISADTSKITPEDMSIEEHFTKYISSIWEEDFESQLSYYRWTYEVASVDTSLLLEKLQIRASAAPLQIQVMEVSSQDEVDLTQINTIGSIYSISVGERLEGGVIQELIIETSKYEIHIHREYNIRYVLGTTEAILQNVEEEVITTTTIAPSAFFVIDTEITKGEVTGYTLTGGGYGHGVGMSQNGAKEMALEGWGCQEILTFFFHGTNISNE